MLRVLIPVLALVSHLTAQECRMRLDEAQIDLHGYLRAFYGCQSLGRSFVMDYNVQRPMPSYADFSYGKGNYAQILKEILNPLGLTVKQGKWMDAIVVLPPPKETPVIAPTAPPAPLVGASGVRGGDSKAANKEEIDIDGFLAGLGLDTLPSSPKSRRLRAKASGLLKSSARRMGFEYSELLAGASGGSPVPQYSQLWEISAIASDSLGTLDFARILDFTAHDTARVIFGSEIRRPESTLNYENGSAITNYSSLFDGLTVNVNGDEWHFVWRGSGSILEVPGAVGSCASGTSRMKFEARRGLPFLSKIPGLKWLFSYEALVDDELLITVCLEVI